MEGAMADSVSGEIYELRKKIESLVGRLQPEDSPGHGEWKALEPEWGKLQEEIKDEEWASKKEDDKEKVRKRLLSLHSMLIRAVELDGPLDEKSIMHYKHAPNWSVVGLTVLAAICMIVVLVWIYMLWPEATGQVRESGGPLPTGQKAVAPSSPAPAGQTTEGAGISTPTPQKPIVPGKSAPAGQPGSEPKSPTPSDQTTRLDKEKLDKEKLDKEKLEKEKQVKESVALLMVVLMGALGGLIHLTSSLAKFVGNRELLRSWLIYYALMPFEGAALAPIIYLLLRVGVLAPSVANTSSTANLNLVGLYAFAGLTGLFSKQAIEMLAEVFGTIFKKIQAKDPSGKEHGGGTTLGKAEPKPGE
jgi:hypothetical protein